MHIYIKGYCSKINEKIGKSIEILDNFKNWKNT